MFGMFGFGKEPRVRPEPSREKVAGFKLASLQYVIVLILLVLVAGLWKLAVAQMQQYRALAEQNRIRKVPILAPRGKILDRDGRLIVDNYPSTTAFLSLQQLKDPEHDLPMIAKGLGLPLEAIQAEIRKYTLQPKYELIPLKQDLTPDEVAFIEAHRNELPELDTIDEQRRLYPKNGFMAHVIGYVGEVSEDMLNDPRYEFYEPGDVVGRSGVEESYDSMLRGQDGSRDVIVNSHNKEVGELGREASVPGKELRLTIDLDIQEAAERAMGNRNGAMIAIDPRTGEVLAMVSRPTFDPNDFAVKIGRKEWQGLITDPDHPLLNKAIQAQLAPGSTFKVIMSVAGLQENVAQTMKVNCAGGASFYGHFFACDKHHGSVDIEHAIPWSCDTYFYTLANRLGIETIAKYAHELGLGQRTGIDLPNEVQGIVPSEEWKMKTFHEKWYAGETISVGIGQGAVAATPIQLVRALSGVASGGVLQRPHVVFPDEQPKNIDDLYPGSGYRKIPLTTENWQIISDGMAGALDPRMDGTASASHLEGIDFAGKTGTAQVISHEGAARTGSKGKKLTPNSWFVGMVPRRNPEIAVAVLWENGDWGANSAKLATHVISAFVDKQRRLQGNARMETAKVLAPVLPASEAAAGDSSAAPVKKSATKPAAADDGSSPAPEKKPAAKPTPAADDSTPPTAKADKYSVMGAYWHNAKMADGTYRKGAMKLHAGSGM